MEFYSQLKRLCNLTNRMACRLLYVLYDEKTLRMIKIVFHKLKTEATMLKYRTQFLGHVV